MRAVAAACADELLFREMAMLRTKPHGASEIDVPEAERAAVTKVS